MIIIPLTKICSRLAGSKSSKQQQQQQQQLLIATAGLQVVSGVSLKRSC